jgi:hypothetical protein
MQGRLYLGKGEGDGEGLFVQLALARFQPEQRDRGLDRSTGTWDPTQMHSFGRKGIIVLRFWNHQVRQELDSVVQAIWFALQERCSSKTSP